MNHNSDRRQMELAALANEATLRIYEISRMNGHKVFIHMSAIDYIAIWLLSDHMDVTGQKRKIYLEYMADKLNLSMGKVSKIVKELQERGLVQWKHDGQGDAGTYIQITDSGIQLAEKQQNILQEYYKNVVEKFGEDRLVQFLGQIDELQQIMDDVAARGDD